jgi:hypothetical protein
MSQSKHSQGRHLLQRKVKVEGLSHASDESNKYMQCTSIPAAVALMKILENVIEEQQDGMLDNIFNIAANYVLNARHRLTSRKLPNDIGINERFFTGAMANAINSVLQDGYCVLHQACIGTGATHSDLSAIRIKTNVWPTTLMVGEGKWNASNLREETRGQMLNELLRHRAIDKKHSEKEGGNFGPLLLVAFDKSKVEIDLAFPSTKDGKLEKDGIVEFAMDLEQGKEAFWTLQILRISIEDSIGANNLPIVLRFISIALQELDSWSGQSRVQHKMPIPLKVLGGENQIAAVVQYAGENVTIIEETSGSMLVVKEYCYHLRQACAVLLPLLKIEDINKRQPPPKELLEKLGSPYSEWIVHHGPFHTSVLCYPFIEGNSHTPSVTGWLKILHQVKMMHQIEFVHGDLHPRNVLFDAAGGGYVIDFDLSRKVGRTYVHGYNYVDFQEFRHSGAQQGLEMMKVHDVHSLCMMSTFFFDMELSNFSRLELDDLIKFFQDNLDLTPRFGKKNEGASGSPIRLSQFALS